MKLTNYIFVFCFFVAALVPTEIFHYLHTVSDLSEHYEHHKDKSVIEFVSHALTSSKDCNSDHPEHHHSPFSHHQSVCGVAYVSMLPSNIVPKIEWMYFTQNNVDFPLEKEAFVFEVSLAIWQPPKLV